MSARLRIPQLLGFDPELLEGLDVKYRRDLSYFCFLGFLPCGLIGGAAGYGLWLVERSALIAGSGALVFALLLLNMLRVAIAGSGMTLSLPPRLAGRWKPRLTPVVIFALLGIIFAQPAQLVLHEATLAPAIDRYRVAMMAAHEKAVRSSDPKHAAARVADYNARIKASSFAVRRVQLLWLTPEKPLIFTVLFTLVALFPLLLVRGPSLAAVVAYEARKYARGRARVMLEDRLARETADRLLSAYPSYPGAPIQMYADAPFHNEPVKQGA
ncbi:MAG: hypothetical protein SGI86_09910 [Deltaproteobacteria bacterium]|nr:hypothetical protein [Deltaproteobacteria bacterium]